MEFQDILQKDKYYSISDLRYNKELGINLNSQELKEFFDFKDSLVGTDDSFFSSCLKSFNSKHIFFYEHEEIEDLYSEYINLVGSTNIFSSGYEEMKRARIYSEIEGSLAIEGINSTRTLFDELVSGRKPENLNENIVKNMADAMEFLDSNPSFDEENLYNLYSIVSRNCLGEDQKLKALDKYRYDMVYISNYNGARPADIKPCMDSLFFFVNKEKRNENPMIRFLLPHIVHYYIVYVHPYFDCNGRIARLCSLWVSNILGIESSPYYISEAINDTKNEYYMSLCATRDSRNDMTYFLKYILEQSIKYALCYMKLNMYSEKLSKHGECLTLKEQSYLKRIMLCSNGYFGWRDFLVFAKIDISKQGVLKILNSFEDQGILVSKINSRKEKMFKVKNW